MVKIPAFYYKWGTYPKDHARSGEKYWIVSGAPFSNALLHPAFSANRPYFYVAAYEASVRPGEDYQYAGQQCALRSVPNVIPAQIITITGNAEYYSGVVGSVNQYYTENLKSTHSYRFLTYKEYEALQILCLIESGHPDVKSIYGKGNCDSGVLKPTGTSGGAWRGIYDLWGNGKEQLYTNHTLYNFAELSDGTITKVGVPPQGSVNIPQFFPTETEENPEVNAYHSYFTGNGSVIGSGAMYRGGDYNLGQKAGLFTITNVTWNVAQATYATARLSCVPDATTSTWI